MVCAQIVDFSKYKDQIIKLLDKYVSAGEAEILSKEISLSDMREFNSYIEDQKNGLSDRSKADAILAQTKKVIREKWGQDEIFYKKFSDLIEKLLSELKTAKQEDLKALLDQAKTYQKAVEDYTDSDIPETFRNTKAAHPFYRNIKPFLNVPVETYNAIISKIVNIIQSRKIVDFQNDSSVRREVINDIEDYLFDEVEEKLNADTVEQIAQTAWNLAVQNKDMI